MDRLQLLLARTGQDAHGCVCWESVSSLNIPGKPGQAALVGVVCASFYLGPQAQWGEAKFPERWRVSFPP